MRKELKTAKEELQITEKISRELEERYGMTFYSNPLPFWIYDFETEFFMEVNDAAIKHYGYSREEFLKMTIRDIRPRKDVNKPESLAGTITGDNETDHGYWQHTKKNGDVIHAEITSNRIKYNGREACLVLANDITERILALQELERSNERFKYVSKATFDAIWDWNLLTKEVTRLGDGLKVLFGYDMEVAAKDNNFWENKVHPEDIKLVREKRNKALKNVNENYWEDEYRFLKSNGQYAYVYDKAFIMRNAEGQAIRIIGATQDITHRKETELVLKSLNESLEKKAEELAYSNNELERFAYVVSHDLQEPLRMVSSFLQLLDKKYTGSLDDKAKEYINFAVKGADHMKKLILDLLTYSKIGTDKADATAVDMNQVLVNVMQIFEEQIQNERITFKSMPLPVVTGNSIQLQQLLQNLIGNAIKYRGEQPLLMEVGCKEEAERFVFYIKDNGIGIGPQYFEKIFVVFQRLHIAESYSGTGIGLAICKKIVEMHQGSIWVESELGKGSLFCFSLPK